MKIILLTLLTMLSSNASSQSKVDFSDSQELNYWYRVNDSVMGGVSQSNLRVVDTIAYFEGVLSLDNNGGFASVRRVGPLALESDGKPILLEIKSDGRDYQLRLRTNKGFDGMAYVATFSSQRDIWQTLAFTEKDFVAQFRGRKIDGAPELLFADVRQIGVMLADKQPGLFRLAIKGIGQ
ncbi:CIA30 family protein [uncultured Paraglaciecola sp.]|jgi:NADH dehydrogenase [ubiquinone] 1 alpha subcomplex assembly factor 1|uniref:CIA30 family protein n=1 Tax=uncultured Paraglaciecola sp. TaxID=1765024 RepID=UPI0025FFA5CD|nr:CIA30 family protein [uncultured Paraglaciecola sp.]